MEVMNLSVAQRARIKGAAGRLLWSFPGRLLARSFIGRSEGLILMFHYIGPPVLQGVSEDLFLERAEFGRILDFARRELQVLDPPDFLEKLSAGCLPDRATLLTFDDGTRDNVTIALPELARRGLKACFFVCPGLISEHRTTPTLQLMTICAQASPGPYIVTVPQHGQGGATSRWTLRLADPASRAASFYRLQSVVLNCPSQRQQELFDHLAECFGLENRDGCPYPLATLRELRLLHDAGMALGNHTLFHSTVAVDGPAQFASHVASAFEVLEDSFPLTQRLFCYPYGRTVDVSEETTRALKKQRVAYGFVTQGGLARPRRTGSWTLHREQASYSLGAVRLSPLLGLLR